MGLGLNWIGANAGYQGYMDDRRRQAEDARRAAAADQAAKDSAYQEEVRSRQRYDWSEADRIRNDAKQANRDYWSQFDQPPASDAPPDGAAPAPAAAAQPAPDAMTDPASQGATTYPVEDPGADVQPLPMTAAASHAAPLDASLDGAPPARAVAPMPQAAPRASAPAARPLANPVPNPVPVDSSLAGAPQRAALPEQQPAEVTPAATPVEITAPPTAAASAPAAAPSAAPAGIPPPRKMGNILDMYAYSLDAAARKGDVSAQGYVQTREFLAKMRSEGVTQALEAFARGDYAGGIALYNNMGQEGGARIVSAEDTTTTLPDGRTMPTRKVTIANANGSRAVIDTTLDRYKMIGLEKQIEMMDKAATNKADADYKTKMGNAAEQNANTQEQYRKDQADYMREKGLAALNGTTGQSAVNWTKEADAYLVQAMRSKDVDGNEANDGAGLTFTKQVGIDYARQHGGDAMAGAGAAVAVNNQIRSVAAANVAKDPKLDLTREVQRLRAEYLKIAMRRAPPVQPGAGGGRPGDYFAGIDPGEAQVLRQVAQAKGVDPNDLAAALRLEASGANAVSPKGAVGRFQITPVNVQAYGGNPLDFRQSAEMAANVLRDAAQRYPDNPRARLAYYNGGAAAGDAVAAGGEPPTDEGRGYVTRYDALAAPVQAPAAAPATTAAAAAKAPAAPPPAPGSANGLTNEAMMEAWVNDKLMGMFDGPAKYAEIARTHPNPAVRKAAASLYAKAKAEAGAANEQTAQIASNAL